ncbi:MAG: GDP-mannose 4,6-dehydratase [Thermodesulfobacteriota bacterium]|nr:GDP-mannose 4,6-dehydratase [Thermodesulfobacteriota bacterium]
MLSFKKEKVLVTGANGFIGYHLTDRLIQEGADVYAFVHEHDNRIKLLKDYCSIFHTDLLDGDALSKSVRAIKPKIVFHLAAIVNVDRSVNLINDMMRVNFQGTVNLLSTLEKIDYECFVNTGTCEEYGDNPVPFKEDQCPRPVSPYSFSKASSTLYCSMIAKTKGSPIITLRPFLTYGPFQVSRMLIPDTIMKSLKRETLDMTKGEQTREFNFVEDIVDGYLKAAIKPEAKGQILNIGNGREYTIREIVLKILDIMGNPITPSIGSLPYRQGETWHFYCDNSKAKRILGWSPKVDLEEGLKRTIEWFVENPHEWEE